MTLNAQVRVVAGAAHRGAAGRGDGEAMLVGAGRRVYRVFRRRHAADAGDVEVDLAGRAHHERRIDRHGDDAVGLQSRRLAGMDAGKDQRRLAGIGWRNDPGIDAEIRRQDDTVPVERGGDAFPALAAGGKEGGDAGDQHQRAQRVRIAPRHPRRRPAGFQRPRGVERALDMGIPQRQRIRIFRRDGEIVGDRGRRAMRQPTAAIDPAQRVAGTGHAHEQERPRRDDGERRASDHGRGATERRQPQPQPEPGQRQEQPDGSRQRGQHRPQPFPENRPARALERRLEQRPGGLRWPRLRTGIGQSRFGHTCPVIVGTAHRHCT